MAVLAPYFAAAASRYPFMDSVCMGYSIIKVSRRLAAG
jgi:hypothetical protein